MPHFIVEYSANVETSSDIQALCEAIRKSALATGVFESGGIRVRAYPARHFTIADAHERNAFLHLQLRVGAGRSVEKIKEAGERIVETIRDFLEPELAEPYFGLSFEIVEIHPELSWKANSIHPRLRGQVKGDQK